MLELFVDFLATCSLTCLNLPNRMFCVICVYVQIWGRQTSLGNGDRLITYSFSHSFIYWEHKIEGGHSGHFHVVEAEMCLTVFHRRWSCYIMQQCLANWFHGWWCAAQRNLAPTKGNGWGTPVLWDMGSHKTYCVLSWNLPKQFGHATKEPLTFIAHDRRKSEVELQSETGIWILNATRAVLLQMWSDCNVMFKCCEPT